MIIFLSANHTGVSDSEEDNEEAFEEISEAEKR
jgi:hypothetical protein